MLASVIVPARDAAETLSRTLAGLAVQQLDGEHEVIVVDDGSSDDTAEIAARAGVRVVRNPSALGPGASRNRGVAAASGAALAFTDADCVPAPGWLAAGVRALETSGIVQGRVEPEPGAEAGPFDKTLWVTRPWGLFESANLFVRRGVFDQVGGFDDGLLELAGAHFGEDVIFGWRARRAGVQTAFCSQALVHHTVARRDAAGFVRSRLRDGLFATLTREVPELRREFLYRRWFLSARSARFALAVVGGLVGAATRRPAIAWITSGPYCLMVASAARKAGPRVALVRVVADAVGFVSLVDGSARAGTLVL
jgi:glycosyltransferase involved in cell wall biosynthesis